MPMKFNGHRAAAFLFLAPAARAPTTVFTCQERLNSSNLAVTGLCDFRFRIFDANSPTPGAADYLSGAQNTTIELFTPATICFYH
jgi:hypothetical protein